jgi:mono/diheme cytochrome c family protein
MQMNAFSSNMQVGTRRSLDLKKYGLMAAIAVGVVSLGCGSKTDDQASSTPDTAKPAASPAASPASGEPAAAGSYAAVQQVFNANCAACHGQGRPRAGINLTSFDAVMAGGRKGPIVKASDPDGSLLVQALHGTNGAKQMPPKGALAADQIKIIEDWVKAGAKGT